MKGAVNPCLLHKLPQLFNLPARAHHDSFEEHRNRYQQPAWSYSFIFNYKKDTIARAHVNGDSQYLFY